MAYDEDEDDYQGGPITADSYSPMLDGSEYKGGPGSGHAVRVMNCGQQYDGHWKDDHEHGFGHLKVSPDPTIYAKSDNRGSEYSGEWQAGMRHGAGTHTWSGGSTYEGQWSSDVKEGKGKLTLANGNTYDGEWKANQRHGWGVYKVAKPTIGGIAVYEGEWYKDVIHGRGTTRVFDGAVEISRYEGGKRVGEGVRWIDQQTLLKPDGTRKLPPVGASEEDEAGPWKLVDGLEAGVIDDAGAAAIASSLALPVPTFPFHES